MSMSLFDLASVVLPWTALWHALFWASRFASSAASETYRSLDGPQRGYWDASVVSTTHALYVTYLATAALLETPKFLVTEDWSLHTLASLSCSTCFLGYILSDLALALYYGRRWSGMAANLFHHVFIVICWGQLLAGRNGQLFALVGALCEASTPFVNGRWFIDRLGLKETTLYVVNGLAMTFSFFVFRVLGFLWMGTRLYGQRVGLLAMPAHASGSILVSYGVGTALQLFWFNKMIRGAAKALGYGVKKAEKKE